MSRVPHCVRLVDGARVAESIAIVARMKGMRWVVLLVVLFGCRKPTTAPVFLVIDFDASIDLLHDTGGSLVLVDESWYVHRIGEAKIGHRWVRNYRDDKSSETRSLVIDQLEIPRFRSVARQTLRTAERMDANGVVQAMAYEHTSGGQRNRVAAVVEGDTLHLRRQVQRGNGKPTTQTSELPWSPSIGGFYALERSLQRKPLEPSETRVVSVLQPISDSVLPYTLKVEPDPNGTTADNQRIVARPNSSGPAVETLTFWVDAQRNLARQDSSFLNRTMVQATEIEAMSPSDIVDFDVALSASVPLAKPLVEPESLRTARYRLRWTGDATPPLVNCSYQRFTAESANSAVIEVGQTFPGPASPAPVPPGPADIQPNRWLEVAHDSIQSLAGAAIGQETDVGKAALAIRAYVYQWLDKTEADQILATARQAAEGRKGDCTEHAMLVASACRAVNVPARIAIGLIYDEPSQSMVYHMWTEIWLDGDWQPIDATRPHGDFNASRIKLAHNNLSDASDVGIVMPVLQAAGRLEIEVLASSP